MNTLHPTIISIRMLCFSATSTVTLKERKINDSIGFFYHMLSWGAADIERDCFWECTIVWIAMAIQFGRSHHTLPANVCSLLCVLYAVLHFQTLVDAQKNTPLSSSTNPVFLFTFGLWIDQKKKKSICCKTSCMADHYQISGFNWLSHESNFEIQVFRLATMILCA